MRQVPLFQPALDHPQRDEAEHQHRDALMIALGTSWISPILTPLPNLPLR